MKKAVITASGHDGDRREYVNVRIPGSFSVKKTFDCGQTFRFEPDGRDDRYTGIAFGKKITFEQSEDDEVRIIGADEREFYDVWEKYLALDIDYDEADRLISCSLPNEKDRQVMKAAVECGKGIRILKQEPFETLISFIISQNNNIPRIKKIVTSLCEKYGEDGAFPTPEAIYGAGVDGIFALKTGFRAGYIIDAAEKVLSGKIDFSEIENSDDYDYCTSKLCSIKGVGPKVSSCILLFGFGKTEAFPIDVWMKRSIERHFSDEFDPKLFGKYAGIAQQYLFYYERWLGGGNI